MDFERCSSNKIGARMERAHSHIPLSLTFIHIGRKRTNRTRLASGRISDDVINIRTDDRISGD